MTYAQLLSTGLSAALSLYLSSSAAAQSVDARATSVSTAPTSAAGAAMAMRSPDGRLQIAAVRAQAPIELDGALDDQVWREAVPVSGFVQSEPHEGQPATEDTQVYVAFDADTLYIGAYCHDTEPTGAIVSEIRKDFASGDQDSFEVILDTFADRRNGFMFLTNRQGAKSDQQVANEGRETNASWDAVWLVKTRGVEDGWTLEIAIPLKSLRFERGDARTWGINFSRVVRRKNEVSHWSPISRAYNLARVSDAGNLVGLPSLSPGRNLRIKPYVLGSSIRDVGDDSFDADGDVGVDVKYGVTPSLTLDVTVNPDFAQVEADEQQVNLTQFSQFFPEKREFFLENSGIFYVGDAQRANRRNPTPTPDEDLLLFFSRRIGLTSDGRAIPMAGGARLTGNAGGFTLGAMSIQTRSLGATPATNYAVVRARKNVFANSDIGAVFMSRQNTDRGGDYNRVFGVDATIRLFGKFDWSSYAVRTVTPGAADGQYAFRSTGVIQQSKYHVRTGMMQIGDGFVSDLSYYRRTGMRKFLLETGYKPRPQVLERRGIRETHYHINWDYQTNLSALTIAKKIHQGVTVSFNNGGWTEPQWNYVTQQLTRPLRLGRNVAPIPPGIYNWTEYLWRFNTDPSRMFSVAFLPTWGGLWTGTQRTVNLSATVRPSYRFRATLGLQRTSADLDLPKTSFVKNLWTLRTNYSFSTNMYLDSLLQYDTDLKQLNSNIRFNLIHRPLSDIFVVYNEQRFSTVDDVEPGRGFVVKYTQMLAF